MFEKIKNKLSFARLAGIKKFIVAEVHQGQIKYIAVKINESPLRISSSTPVNGYEIVFSGKAEYETEFEAAFRKVKKLADENNFSEAQLLIGISEYRLITVSVPSDTDDIELWFIENSGKFLPGGQQADEFIFDQTKISESDEFAFYNVLISRKDYIEAILKATKHTGFNPLLINATSLAVHSLSENFEKNIIFIDCTGSKVVYSISDSDGAISAGEFYLSENINSLNGSAEIKSNLNDLRQSCQLEMKEYFFDELTIYLNSDDENINSIFNLTKEIFPGAAVIKNFNNYPAQFLGAMFKVNSLISNFDEGLNLLDEEEYNPVRFGLEKQFAFRTIILTGSVLILFLLGLYYSESYINSMLEEGEDQLVNVTAKLKMVEQTELENSKLKANLRLLDGLKEKGLRHDELLYSIYKIIENGDCLTRINIKDENGTHLEFTIEGFTPNQENVAYIMRGLEETAGLRDISLLSSNALKKEYITETLKLNEEELFKFSISAKYYGN